MLRSAAAALGALVLLAGCGGTPEPTDGRAPSSVEAPRIWTLVSTAPRGLPGPWSGIERFAADVERASAGRQIGRAHV